MAQKKGVFFFLNEYHFERQMLSTTRIAKFKNRPSLMYMYKSIPTLQICSIYIILKN